MFDIHSSMKRSTHMVLKRDSEWKEPTCASICISATVLYSFNLCTFRYCSDKKTILRQTHRHINTWHTRTHTETYKVKTIPAPLSLLVKWFYTTLKDMQINPARCFFSAKLGKKGHKHIEGYRNCSFNNRRVCVCVCLITATGVVLVMCPSQRHILWKPPHGHGGSSAYTPNGQLKELNSNVSLSRCHSVTGPLARSLTSRVEAH